MYSHENSRTYSTSSRNTENNSPAFKKLNHTYNINIEESKNDYNDQEINSNLNISNKVGISSPKAYEKFMDKIKLYYYLKHPSQREQSIVLNPSLNRSIESPIDNNKEISDKEEYGKNKEENVVFEKKRNIIDQAKNVKDVNIIRDNNKKNSLFNENQNIIYNNEKIYNKKRRPFNENILIIDNEESKKNIDNNNYDYKINNNETYLNQNIDKYNKKIYNVKINNEHDYYNIEKNKKNSDTYNSNIQSYTDYQEQQNNKILSNVFNNYEPTSQNSFKDKEFISKNYFIGNYPINDQNSVSFENKNNNVNNNYYEPNKYQKNDINHNNNKLNDNNQSYILHELQNNRNNHKMRVNEPIFLNVKNKNRSEIFKNNNNLDSPNISNIHINNNYIKQNYYSPKFYNNNKKNNSNAKINIETNNYLYNQQTKFNDLDNLNNDLIPDNNDKNQKENKLTALLYGLLFGLGTTCIFWLGHKSIQKNLYEKIRHLNIYSVINFFKHLFHPINIIKSIFNNEKFAIYKKVFKLAFIKIFDYFESYGDAFRILCIFIIIYSFWLILKNFLKNLIITWKYYNQ